MKILPSFQALFFLFFKIYSKNTLICSIFINFKLVHPTDVLTPRIIAFKTAPSNFVIYVSLNNAFNVFMAMLWLKTSVLNVPKHVKIA